MAKGIGNSILRAEVQTILLSATLDVPNFLRDLVSGSRLARTYDILLRARNFPLLPKGQTDKLQPIAQGQVRNGVYEFPSNIRED